MPFCSWTHLVSTAARAFAPSTPILLLIRFSVFNGALAMLMRLAMMMASVGCKRLLDKSTDVAVFSSPIGSSATFSLSLFNGALKNPTESGNRRVRG